MFNDDEDYGFLTGGLGDLDGDGDVDFTEYMNEEDNYQRIFEFFELLKTRLVYAIRNCKK